MPIKIQHESLRLEFVLKSWAVYQKYSNYKNTTVIELKRFIKEIKTTKES